MWREILADPKVRRAYVLTKIGVFVGAALLTIPLAGVIGAKAWVGLGVFGALLLALTAAVLGMGRSTPRDASSAPADDQELDADSCVELPVEDWIDLHSFPPRDIPEVVEAYLEQAVSAGLAEVRLIHGRGTGVQRQRVRSVLDRHPSVTGFADATPDRGGWGATVAWLGAREDSPAQA